MISPLRQRMIDEMTLRGMSPRTHEAYLGAVLGLTRYYRRPPDQLTIEDIRGYLLHLERERKVSWSTLNSAASGLRFFYFKTLKWEPAAMEIPPRRTPQRLPEVLSREEVDRLLSGVDNVKHQTALMTVYAAGLRLSEVIHLKVGDIDSSRMAIRVVQGKGRKDRYTLLSPKLLDRLRGYWKRHPSKDYLFFGASPDKPLHESSLQRAYTQAKLKAGIRKNGGLHTLRHCFATHLLEAGVDLRTIQVLLGHGEMSTTARYLLIRSEHLQAHATKFDLLAVPSKTDGL
jgi:site-specific recombinase XerD